MLDKSFCAKPNKRVWPTTYSVVTQTHLSRIGQRSLSVLCRDSIHSRMLFYTDVNTDDRRTKKAVQAGSS